MTATRRARASGQLWQGALKAHTIAHSCYATFLDDHHTNNTGLSAGWVRVEAAALLYIVNHPGPFPWPRARDKSPPARYTPPEGALTGSAPPAPPPAPLWQTTPVPGAAAAAGATPGKAPPPPAPPARPIRPPVPAANDLTAAQSAPQPAPQPTPTPTDPAPEPAVKPEVKPKHECTPLPPALAQA